MSKAPGALESKDSGQTTPLEYDAFLSYTHRDRPVVTGIQKGLHHIGRRLGRLRALRVFRDDTDLTASPDLWARITDAMDRSRFLIATMSPDAAASYWVNKEVSYWLEHRGRAQLLLVLAAGHLKWDEDTARFDPRVSDAAPPVLTVPGSLPAEPLYIDVTEDAPWDYRAPTFHDKITALAAPIHGKPKDQLASDDLREQRRFRRLRSAAIAGLVVLTVVASAAALIAVIQRQEAIRQRNAAIALSLVSGAQAMLTGGLGGGDVRALEQLLAARELGLETGSRVDPNITLGGLLDGAVRRRDELKIIEAPACQAESSEQRLCPVHGVAFSPDGHRLVFGDDHGDLHRRYADSGQAIGEPIRGNHGPVESVDVSSRYIVSGHGDNTVQLWDAETGDHVSVGPMTHHGVGIVRSVAFNPLGNLIASGGDDKTVRLWDVKTGKQVAVGPMTHDGVVRSVAFNSRGNLIVSAGSDERLRVWEANTGRLLAYAETHSQMLSVAFSPDGKHLVSGDKDGIVEVWDVPADLPVGAATINPAGPPITGHRSAVQSVAFSPTNDGSRIVSGGVDGTVRVWNTQTGQPIGDPLAGHHGQIWAVAFSRDGRRIVSGGFDGTVREWDAVAGLPIPAGQRKLHAVALSPNGQQIASGGYDGTVKLWSTDTGQQIGPPFGDASPRDEHAVLSVAFSPDGSEIVSGGRDGKVTVWDVATRKEFDLEMLDAPPTGNFVQSVTFSEDGTRIASGGDDGAVRLWDAKSHEAIPLKMRIGDHSGVLSVAFSPTKGRRIIATGSTDNIVRLWDADTGKPEGLPLEGHT
ncbi:MAG: repeat-containing protein, partial [Mycobacterium sp.]|nr:repeat-containing protein [Mycobacterium sp.]